MAALSYMQRRRSGIYEFRKRLPQSLAGKPVPAHMREHFSDLINAKTGQFKREFVRSLDTKEVRRAKTRDHHEALRLARRVDDALAALERPVVPPETRVVVDAKEIGEAVYRNLLADDEAERVMGDDRRRIVLTEYDPANGEDAVVTRSARWPDLTDVPSSSAFGMQDDHAHVYGLELDELRSEYRAAFARRDPSIVSAETTLELKRRGASYNKSSPEFQVVALEVLRAHVRAYEVMEKRHRGADVPTPIDHPPATRGPLLSDAFEVWKAGGGSVRGSKKPSENTVTEANQAVRYFKELFGHMRLADITRRVAREFRDKVAKVPKNLPADLRKLPLSKLLERTDLASFPSRGATTVNKTVQLLGAIVSKAEAEAMLDEVTNFANPFGKGVKFKVDDGDTEQREIFSKADLRAIFGSPVYAKNWRTEGGQGEAPFWLPLVGLLTGMRLSEMTQLRICDLRQDENDDGVWFFDVHRTGGRSTKTSSSIRRIPLHPELERIGLLRYCAWLVQKGHRADDPMWPGVKAAAWSKWINPYLRSHCGIMDESKVFHSFRHTFKRMTRDAGLYEELHDAITGHANKGSVGREYGRGFSIKPLAKAMARVEPAVDLARLIWRIP
jgi:integrase